MLDIVFILSLDAGIRSDRNDLMGCKWDIQVVGSKAEHAGAGRAK